MTLNSLIQTLRTVTFVLQKELKHAAWFGDRYESQREQMHADKRMRWLHDARNAIEKEGDLDTHSVAHVTVTSRGVKASVKRMEIDPAASAQEVARKIQLAGLPQRLRREGTLVIERRWTVQELEGDEILDALAHCYGHLLRIVDDAIRFGQRIPGCPNRALRSA